MPGVEKVQGQVVNNNGTTNDTLIPVVKTAVVVQKQSALKKFWKGLFAEDFKPQKNLRFTGRGYPVSE